MDRQRKNHRAGRLGIAESIGGGIPSFQAYLMSATLTKIYKEIFIQRHSAVGTDVYLRHPAGYVGVERIVPRAIQGVGYIDSVTVSADFHHLRRAHQRAGFGMRRLAHDAAQLNSSGKLGVKGV